MSFQAATIIFSLIDPASNYWAMAFLVMIFVPGADIAYTVVNLHVCSAFDADSQGLAGSVFVVTTRVSAFKDELRYLTRLTSINF